MLPKKIKRNFSSGKIANIILKLFFICVLFGSIYSVSSLVAQNLALTSVQHRGLPEAEAASPAPEPLTSAEAEVTRVYSFPVVKFFGVDAGFLNVTSTWYSNGTTTISDDRGHHLDFEIPAKDGSISLYHNSTTVDQKYSSPNLNYDIIWKTVKNPNGDVKLKFVITGKSIGNGNSTISLKIKQSSLSPQGILFDQNRFLISSPDNPDVSIGLASPLQVKPNSLKLFERAKSSSVIDAADIVNATIPRGIGFDWSDAIKSGYSVRFDPISTSLIISVPQSFDIDPVLIDTTSSTQAPPTTDYSEGEKRIVSLKDQLFAFYSINYYIYYWRSTNDGATWTFGGSAVPEVVASDNYRWTVGTARNSSGNEFVIVYYYTQSGTTVSYYSWRGQVTANGITWDGAHTLIFSTTVSGTCGCSASVVANDNSSTPIIYAAFRYLSTSGTYSYQIMKSSNAAASWTTSLSATSSGYGNKIEMGITTLSNGRMLFLYATYPQAELNYRVFDGTNWGALQTTSGAGMTTNSVKQISVDSDTSKNAFAAYLASGNSGTLKVAKWNSAGTFLGFETGDSTKSHQLPSMSVTYDSAQTTPNILRIYTLSGGRIYETDRINGAWNAPVDAFRLATTYDNPNQLTSALSYPAALWTEKATTPYNVMFGSTPSTYAAIGMNGLIAKVSQFTGYSDFHGTTASKLTSDVQSILSAGGVKSSTGELTQMMYQQDIRVANDDTVRADSQVWNSTGNVFGCFKTNSCYVLASPISSLDYAYHNMYWSGSSQVLFYSEGHLNGGAITYNLQTYTKVLSDISDKFSMGPQVPNHYVRSPQLGVESDFDTYNWQVKQYGWVFYPVGGSATNFSDKNFEVIRAGSCDEQYGSALTPAAGVSGCGILVGESKYDTHADFYCNNSLIPKGTITWSHATSTGNITPDGKYPWSVPGTPCN